MIDYALGREKGRKEGFMEEGTLGVVLRTEVGVLRDDSSRQFSKHFLWEGFSDSTAGSSPFLLFEGQRLMLNIKFLMLRDWPMVSA